MRSSLQQLRRWGTISPMGRLVSLCAALGSLAIVCLFAWSGNSQSAAKPSRLASAPYVLYYGDSLAAEAHQYFQDELGTSVVDRTYPGSAPCDWTQAVKLDLSRGTPKAVIIETFGNNISDCTKVSGQRVPSESKAYWAMYQDRLQTLINRFPRTTRIWLNAPPAAKNDLSAGRSHKAVMLQTMKGVAATRPNTFVVDAGAAVESPQGEYSAYAACSAIDPECSNVPRGGWTRVRAKDGLHFCPTIEYATVAQLRNCPVYSPGAKRFALAQAEPVKKFLGL